jgi:hypothetical protein
MDIDINSDPFRIRKRNDTFYVRWGAKKWRLTWEEIFMLWFGLHMLVKQEAPKRRPQ